MIVSNETVEEIAKKHSINVPDFYKDNPRRALTYIRGYLTLKGSEYWPLLDEIKESMEPGEDKTLSNAFHFGFDEGHPSFVKSYKLQIQKLVNEQGCKNTTERKLDLVEIHRRMERNPSFIPFSSWPNAESF